jgi:hypothetical protein
MDEIGPEVGLKAGRFLTVVHHVFFAALILAMDVSFNPHAPDAESRKTKVLAAYQTLEKSKQESNYLMEGIQKNLQTLMSTLQKDRPQASQLPSQVASTAHDQSTHGENEAQISSGLSHSAALPPPSAIMTDGSLAGTITLSNDINEEGWEQLWSEFVAIAPGLDAPQWSLLLEDVDFNPQLDIY